MVKPAPAPFPHPHILITRREWRGVGFVALIVSVLTTLPTVLACLLQGPFWRFNGFLLFGIEDGNAYLGKMRLGARGLWEFFLFYTPEKHQGASLLYWPYMLPGHLLGLFINDHDPLLFSAMIVMFHVLRVGFSVLLIFVLYRFIAEFLPNPATRFLALVIALFGGGFGWLLLFAPIQGLSSLPPEFYIPEGFSLIALLGLPHILLARAALFGGFLALFKALRTEEPKRWLTWAGLAGLCWIIIGLCVSFYFVILYCLMAAWGLAAWLHEKSFPWKLTLRGTVAVIPTLPLFFYYVIVFTQNDAFATWSSQNRLPSPNPFNYLLAYGVLAALAWVGSKWAWKQKADSRYWLLVSWVVVVPFLVYLPINVQRRMAEGILVPLAILAVAGMRLLILPLAARRHTSLQKTWRRLRQTVLTLTTVSSSLFLLLTYVAIFNHTQPTFRPKDELTALDWLNTYADDSVVILSSKRTSNLIPTRTNLGVFLGHDVETLDAKDKEKQVKAFFRDEISAEARLAFYQHYHIRFIFYGPLERELATERESSPDWATSLQLIYDHNGYQVYEVVP